MTRLEFKDCNLPESLFRVVKGQSDELLRQCTQPPVRRSQQYVNISLCIFLQILLSLHANGQK